METFNQHCDDRVLCLSCTMPMTKAEDFGDNPAYCRHCYVDGALRDDVTMDDLTTDAGALLAIESAHPNLVSTPLLAYIKTWLALDEAAKAAAVPALLAALTDGQNCDFTGTQWEREWLADGNVCHCIACVAARKCISDIKRMEADSK